MMAVPAGLFAAQDWPNQVNGISLTDYHVHRDGTTVEKLLEISRQRGVKFGIVEHAGKRENDYPIILSNDDELASYIAGLEGKPVFKGVQAEYLDWMSCFSKEAVAKLDYVLSDAMTIRGKDGRRVKMWSPGFEVGDPERFMDHYVEFHEEVIAAEPIDILANCTWLPKAIEKEYDRLWTPKRFRKIIDAAVKHGVALEINSLYLIPRLPLLRMAKEAGVKFSFGSNIRGPNVGKLDYCVEVIKALGLTRKDWFMPAPPGKKPIEIRK
jgi:histidinol phosphatase-like PHP family hydrolase